MTDFFNTSQHYYWNVNILKISELSKFQALKILINQEFAPFCRVSELPFLYPLKP